MWWEMCYPGSGRKETEQVKGDSLRDSLIMCHFSLSPRGMRRRVEKFYLEGVLKEIHVGINPDIIESAQHVLPSSPIRAPLY